MKKTREGDTYEDISSRESWGFVQIDPYFKARRLPIPDDLLAKRRAHMVKMYERGIPYSWIAKFYELNRSQVMRIIKDLPNN